MSAALAFLAGLLCGVLSGFGIGGGTLLVLYMTLWGGVEQRAAQGINLLFFLPTAACALLLHCKNRLVDWRAAIPAALGGSAAAAAAAWLAGRMETGLLGKLFGGFLILVGLRELFSRPRRDAEEKKDVQ